MADFLDRYGEQLRLARRPRRRRTFRRGALASLVIIAVAAPAVAVVQPWTPPLGRPEHDLNATIDRAPVDPQAVEQLAILRRPQTARDRELAAPRLRHAGGIVQGVQVDDVRAFNEHYALVPITKLDDPGGPDAGPMLCLMGGGGAACGPIDTLAKQGVTLLRGGKDGTRYTGIVPDGVARVRFTPEGGEPAEVAVTDNFYDLHVPQLSEGGPVNPPPGWKGGEIPPPPMPAHGRLEWLDANGTFVGPVRP